jgi:predicted nuclease of predicted toxin-antitoxin system
MRLYLDEDSSAALLAELLRKAGHDVETVRERGRTKEPDPVVFTYAIREGRAVVSRNHRDFKLLHDLVIASGGSHPGVLITRFDNDAARDFTPRGIVVAIGKLNASGLETRDEIRVLNQWR